MLGMMQKVFFGVPNSYTENVIDITKGQKLILSIIVLTILILGIYPGPLLHLTRDTITQILQTIK